MAKQKAEKKSDISVSFNFNGKDHQLKGESIAECLSNLPSELLSSKSTLTARKGDKKFSIILYPRIVRRLLVNKVAKDVLEKRFLMILG